MNQFSKNKIPMQSKEPDYDKIVSKIDSLVPEKSALEKQLDRLKPSLINAYERGIKIPELSNTLKSEGINASSARLRKLLIPSKPRKARQKKETSPATH
jgi:hypothetical protein